MYTFSDWHKTAWDKINVDSLGEEVKKLQKEVRTLNKAVSVATALLWLLCWAVSSTSAVAQAGSCTRSCVSATPVTSLHCCCAGAQPRGVQGP